MNREPCRLLRYAQITVHLHGGHSPEIRGKLIGSYRPFLIWYLGRLHCRYHLDGEVLVAFGAPVPHGRAWLFLGLGRSTVVALAPILPDATFEPPFG